MTVSSLRRPALTAVTLLATLITTIVGVATPAGATHHNAATQAQVDAYLAIHPGGIQINAREISYGNGIFIVTVTPLSVTASPDCPSGWFCFYDGINYTYPRGKLSSCGWQDLGTWGWRNRTESVHYNMSRGTVGFLNETGATDTLLFTAGTTKRTIADTYPHRNKADYVSRTHC